MLQYVQEISYNATFPSEISVKGCATMNVNYLGKKTAVKDQFKNYAEKKLKKLEKFFDDDPDVNVIVTNNNEEDTVEVTIKSHGMFFRAERTSKDRFTSIDLVADALIKQIVRNKARIEKGFKNMVIPTPEEAGLVPGADTNDADVLVKTKKFYVRVMDPEEAILQMNMLGHEFFMFRNNEDGEINVVYRRKDGNYGLLEPIKE